MKKLLIVLAFAILPLAYVAFGLFQLVAGFVGLSSVVGGFLAVIIIIASLYYRFSLPITVGAFIGMYVVWGWPLIVALLITVPSLLLMIPAFTALLVTSMKKSFVKTSRYRPQTSSSNGDDDIIEGKAERVD